MKIIRSKRKTIALIIQPDGSLEVRAPLRATDRQIRQLVEDKAGWIRAKQAIAVKNQPSPKLFVRGESFLFLGHAYRLELVESARQPLVLDGTFYLDKACQSQAHAVFTAWYRQQAYRVFSEQAAHFSARYRISYQQLKITSARTRWGSCSSRGTLSFTWRLVMAPLPVIDYVVVHELVHILEKNHGKGFWEKLAAILPDYKQRLEWLKQNGNALTI